MDDFASLRPSWSLVAWFLTFILLARTIVELQPLFASLDFALAVGFFECTLVGEGLALAILEGTHLAGFIFRTTLNARILEAWTVFHDGPVLLVMFFTVFLLDPALIAKRSLLLSFPSAYLSAKTITLFRTGFFTHAPAYLRTASIAPTISIIEQTLITKDLLYAVANCTHWIEVLGAFFIFLAYRRLWTDPIEKLDARIRVVAVFDGQLASTAEVSQHSRTVGTYWTIYRWTKYCAFRSTKTFILRHTSFRMNAIHVVKQTLVWKRNIMAVAGSTHRSLFPKTGLPTLWRFLAGLITNFLAGSRMFAHITPQGTIIRKSSFTAVTDSTNRLKVKRTDYWTWLITNTIKH